MDQRGLNLLHFRQVLIVSNPGADDMPPRTQQVGRVTFFSLHSMF